MKTMKMIFASDLVTDFTNSMERAELERLDAQEALYFQRLGTEAAMMSDADVAELEENLFN